jgi:hypothetical protein
MFPLYKIINGDPRHSDHRPIIAELNEQAMWESGERVTSMFRFEARWLHEEQCEEIVMEAWDQAFVEGAFTVGEALNRVGCKLLDWDREVLGELKHRIKRAKKDLEECRRGPLNQRQVSREHMLRYKLNRLEDQHSVYWQQRAHVNWLKKGDRNTGFFMHMPRRGKKQIV